MQKTTDLDGVKEQTIILARAVQPTIIKDLPFLCIHPFFNSPIWSEQMIKDGFGKAITDIPEKYDLTKTETYEKWLMTFEERINKCTDLRYIYMFYDNPWKLTFMRFCGQYLSKKDYAEYLANAWISEENPNMDSNVSISKAISMFKQCPKEYLMCEEDLAYYHALPEEIDVYRGVAQGRVKLGLSWTDDIEKAKWFQHRFGDDNHLLHLKVKKKNVLAYFNTRGEKEIVLDVMKYKKEII